MNVCTGAGIDDLILIGHFGFRC